MSGRFSPRSCSCIRTGTIPSSSERFSSPSSTCSATPFANDWEGKGLSVADGTANEFSFCARRRHVEAAMRKKRPSLIRPTNVSNRFQSGHSFSVSVREKCAWRGHCWTARAPGCRRDLAEECAIRGIGARTRSSRNVDSELSCPVLVAPPPNARTRRFANASLTGGLPAGRRLKELRSGARARGSVGRPCVMH